MVPELRITETITCNLLQNKGILLFTLIKFFFVLLVSGEKV